MTKQIRTDRWPRRVRVSFWRKATPERQYAGYTNNVSLGGAYVATPTPVGQNARIQIEFLSESNSFAIEALVLRSKAAPRDLRKVIECGMGLRFLGADEMLAEIAPSAGFSGANRGSGPRSLPTGNLAREANNQGASRSRQTNPEANLETLVRYPVHFSSFEQFQQLYDRDIRRRSLLITTPRPAETDHEIAIELHLPGAGGLIELRAKVVQVSPVPPHRSEGAASSPSQRLASMSVQLIEDPKIFARLDEFVRS